MMIDTQHAPSAITVSALREQGRLDEAEAASLKLIKAEPANAEGYFQCALIAMQKKRWGQSIHYIKKAIALNPEDARYHANRGAALFMMDKYTEAQMALEDAVRLDANHTTALNNLAYIYCLFHRNFEAERLLIRSLNLDPNQPDAWLNMCYALQGMDFREEDMVHYARQAVKLTPDRPTPYTFLSKALLRQGAPLEALDAIGIAVHLDSKNPDFHFHMGVCHLQLEQVPEAIQAFQAALSINPKHADTYYALAEFLYRIEDFEAAEEACRQALELQAYKIPAQTLLSKILFVEGKYDEARTHHIRQRNAFRELHKSKRIIDGTLVAPVKAVNSWSAEHGLPVKVLLPAKVWQPAKPVIFGHDQVEVDCSPVTLPPVYVAEVANATILPGHEVILADQEKIALYDRLVYMGDWHCLREDETIPLISNDHVLVDMGPKVHARIKEGIFLMTEAWYNYAHWISEQIPRLFLIEQMPEYDGVPLLINEGLYPQQLESLQLLAAGRYPIQILERGKRYEVERLICPSILNAYHKRRYRQNEAAKSADGAFHPEAIRYLRDRYLPLCPPPSSLKKRIWISRKQQLKLGQRRMLNETELEALFHQHGFETVLPESMSFAEQVALFSQAEMIAGPGGSAFMNMLFAPADAKILIFTKNHPEVNFHYFTNIAQIVGQSIAYLCGDSVKNLGVLGFETDFTVDVEITRKALREFFGIRQ